MRYRGHAIALFVSVAAGSALAGSPTLVRVRVENLAPSNGVALSPFAAAFHDGTFDGFNSGAMVSPGVQTLAEVGDPSGYLSEFAADQPGGVSGAITASMNSFGPGIYLPGGSGSMTFNVNPFVHRFFSFGSMVVPSNDRFLGNDSPTGVEIFDSSGVFVASSITLFGSQIWDAGSEVNGAFGAAFVAGSDATDHVAQGGVVGFDHDFSVYDGVATPAGYDFTQLPQSEDAIARITFTLVPAPATGSLGLIGLAALRRRR